MPYFSESLVLRISIKMQKNELRVNFYTPVLNTKQNQMDDNKANTNNPILKFDLESGLSVEFRAFGPNNNVGFVVKNNGETTFNSLIDNEGNFISSKINEKDLKILTGETSIQCPANETIIQTVTFPEAFSEMCIRDRLWPERNHADPSGDIISGNG